MKTKQYYTSTLSAGGGTFLYFIRAEGDLAVKIGIANDVHLRLRALQTSHYRTLFVEALLVADTRDKAAAIERAVHRLYWSQRISGEWYSLAADEVQQARKYAAIIHSLDYGRIDEKTQYSLADVAVAPDLLCAIEYLAGDPARHLLSSKILEQLDDALLEGQHISRVVWTRAKNTLANAKWW